MKLYQEMRLQTLMILTAILGCGAAFTFLILGAMHMEWLYFVCAAVDLVATYVVITVGLRRAQQTIARVKRIREGYGDEADLEWSARKGSGFTKVNK
jgi:hypothetical protein